MKTNAVKRVTEAAAEDLTYLEQGFIVGGALGLSLDAYMAAPADGDSPEETREMVESFYGLFETMLPGASREMLEALTNLCAVETGRYRLEKQADAGGLPAAKILDVGGE